MQEEVLEREDPPGTPAGGRTCWKRCRRWREGRDTTSNCRAEAKQTHGQAQTRTVFQEQNQMQRVSFTIVVSTFRLPKIPFTDWMSLIKRMSPVLPG